MYCIIQIVSLYFLYENQTNLNQEMMIQESIEEILYPYRV